MTLHAPGEPASRSAASRFAYDVFVVHADAMADEAFVNGYLLPKLGLAPERVLRLQTLELAQSITAEIERGVRSSRVTLVVLSSAYMDDRRAALGEQLAAYASVVKDIYLQGEQAGARLVTPCALILVIQPTAAAALIIRLNASTLTLSEQQTIIAIND